MLFANKVCVYYFMENKERHSDWKRAFELSEATVGGRSGCWVDDGQLRTILIFPITRVVPFYAIRVIKGSKRERVFNICFPKIFVLLSGGGWVLLVPFSTTTSWYRHFFDCQLTPTHTHTHTHLVTNYCQKGIIVISLKRRVFLSMNMQDIPGACTRSGFGLKVYL